MLVYILEIEKCLDEMVWLIKLIFEKNDSGYLKIVCVIDLLCVLYLG